jgi:hypothetical protein
VALKGLNINNPGRNPGKRKRIKVVRWKKLKKEK